MVLGGGMYHFLVGPLTALLALGIIVLICRWVFSPPKQAVPSPAVRRGPLDYGLLVPVTRVSTADDAERLRAVLQEAGIRCTVASDSSGPVGDDARLLLVFRDEAQRASALVGS